MSDNWHTSQYATAAEGPLHAQSAVPENRAALRSVSGGTAESHDAPANARFAEVYADDGALVVETGLAADCPDPNAGSLRVLTQQPRTLPLPDAAKGTRRIKVDAADGSSTVNYSIVWRG